MNFKTEFLKLLISPFRVLNIKRVLRKPSLETLPQRVPPLLDDEPVPHAVSRDVPLPIDRVEIVVLPQAGDVVGAERGGVAAVIAVHARLEAVRGVDIVGDG